MDSTRKLAADLVAAYRAWRESRHCSFESDFADILWLLSDSAAAVEARPERIPSSAAIAREMLGELEELGRSHRHLKGLRNDLRPVVEKFPSLQALSDAELVAYLRSLSVGPRRRDNVLCSIVQLSRYAKRRNYLPENSRSAAEKVRKIKPACDVVTWTLPEVKLLLENVSTRWLPFTLFGLFAGLRSSEILRLDWSAVKFDERIIAVSGKVARKIRISRLVPIEDNLLAWLEPYCDRVGPLYPGNFKTNENAHCVEMVRIRRATGLPRKDNANRHSYGSYSLALTQNYAEVSSHMGNSPRMLRENYNNPQSKADGLAYFAILPPPSENIIPMPLPLEFDERPRNAKCSHNS